MHGFHGFSDGSAVDAGNVNLHSGRPQVGGAGDPALAAALSDTGYDNVSRPLQAQTLSWVLALPLPRAMPVSIPSIRTRCPVCLVRAPAL